jgi:hypothetical protein
MAQKIYPLLPSILINMLLTLPLVSIAEDYKRTVINDPSISRGCEVLSEKRTQKIDNKQKILAMIERNKHLQKIAPLNKVTVKRKLETNLGHLEHELILTQTQIQYQEENIVRKGCPGISL